MSSHTISETAYWTKAAFYLPYFWYLEGVRAFTRTVWRMIVYLDQMTATTTMARLLFVPLFGDYSLFGRIFGLPFRLIRVILGAAAIILGTIGTLGAFLVWFLLPFWLLLKFPAAGAVLLAVGWLAAFATRLGKPHLLIEQDWQDGFHILDFASEAARGVIRSSRDPETLFKKLLASRAGKSFVFRAGIPQVGPEKVRKLELGAVYRKAYELSFQMGFKYLGASHLLAALFQLTGEGAEDAAAALLWEKRRQDWTRLSFLWDEDYGMGAIGGVNRGWTGRVTPTLDNFSVDLTKEAAAGHLRLMIGKKAPLAEVARVLGRARKANALLVGPPGSGKSSLVNGIAQEVVRGSRFESFRGKRVILLDVGALVAGAETEGELGERLQKIILEIETSLGIILFIDEIHNLVLSGGEVPVAFVFNSLRPHLDTGKFQLVGATSWENYRKYIAPNEAFAQVFELVEVPAASKEESIEILEYESLGMERESRKTGNKKLVRVAYPAIRAAVELSDRLIYDRVLPDKALDLLEEAVLARQNAGGGPVGEGDVAALVAEKTKVPVTRITGKEAKALLDLEKEIHRELIDQEEAVKGVSDALRRARAGLREEEKPIATFLFAGPTGVGKTELSKVLAKKFFGGKEAMVRVDMSEFADLKNIYRLIGSPPGDRAGESGQLTEAIRQRPFSLVLLDEFEKAHPQIMNLFLQVFDDGRLTDGRGETVDFTHTIIIATSNAGTKYIQDQLAAGRSVEEFKKEFIEQIRTVFPPELLNRFDGVMVFKPLSAEHLAQIVGLKVKGLEKDLAVKNIKLVATSEFVKKIAELGYAPEWGARPLTRVMQDMVEAPLAKKILAGEVEEGQTVTLDLQFLQDRV